jgi:hypothetical protein
MRVACIKNGIVVNVIEVENLDKVPNVVGVDEKGNLIKKEEVKIIPTSSGSVGDIYIEGKGFFRFVGE